MLWQSAYGSGLLVLETVCKATVLDLGRHDGIFVTMITYIFKGS